MPCIAIILPVSRYTGPKNKLSRREGKDLFGSNKPSLLRRLNQAPGQHGNSRKRPSEFSSQLREKQKIKIMYGVRERQLKTIFTQAAKNKSVPTGEGILQTLEMRLDNVAYRLGLSRTRPQARQFVVQGRILVDGEVVKAPSYKVKPGQTVTFEQKAFESPFIQAILKNATSLPEWLKVESGKGHVLRLPTREEIDKDIDENAVVAFYTR